MGISQVYLKPFTVSGEFLLRIQNVEIHLSITVPPKSVTKSPHINTQSECHGVALWLRAKPLTAIIRIWHKAARWPNGSDTFEPVPSGQFFKSACSNRI
jgi:hypothetical protein